MKVICTDFQVILSAKDDLGFPRKWPRTECVEIRHWALRLGGSPLTSGRPSAVPSPDLPAWVGRKKRSACLSTPLFLALWQFHFPYPLPSKHVEKQDKVRWWNEKTEWGMLQVEKRSSDLPAGLVCKQWWLGFGGWTMPFPKVTK